jgi:cell volume regulation protein A
MAIALTIGLIDWIEKPGYGMADLTLLIVRQLGIGLVIGLALGAAATWVFARLPHSIGSFAPVASIAAGALSFGIADVSGGSGFLAVYLVGLAVGSTPSRFRRHLVTFHEGLAFVAQVVMFVVLGLLVFPRELGPVALSGLALAALLVLLIRPIAVVVSTAWGWFNVREQALLGWAGLRGAVPIVLGTIVLSEHLHNGETIFNAVFFVVVLSTLVQGTTLEWVAERLQVISLAPPTIAPPLEVDALGSLDLVDFDVAPDHAIAGSAVRELGLPRTALVAVVARGDETIPPRGSTVIEPGDRLFVLAPHSMRPEIEDVFSRWRRRV